MVAFARGGQLGSFVIKAVVVEVKYTNKKSNTVCPTLCSLVIKINLL